MKDRYTIILIPPDSSMIHQFQFSKRVKKYIIIGILITGIVTIGLFARNFYLSHYIKDLSPTLEHIAQLKSTIKEREQEISTLNEKSLQITEDLSRIQDLEKKLSSLVQLHPTPSFNTSLSRSINPAAQNFILANPTVLIPEQNAQIVANHLSLLERYYAAAILKKNHLDHTPSFFPVEGEITSSYGYRRNPFGGISKEFHNGIDIACDYGTPVLATADGIVTFAGTNAVYGLRVDIDHGHGVESFYAHNSRLLVKEGDIVNKHDQIAYSGNSGRSTGSHLHYGTIVNGKNVDPLRFHEKTKGVIVPDNSDKFS